MTIAVLVITVLALGLIWNGMPTVARVGMLFGVTVSSNFSRSPDGRRILRGYRQIVWAATGAAIVLLLGAFSAEVRLGIVFPVVIGLQLVAYNLAVVRANRKAAMHSVDVQLTREAQLHGRPSLIPGGATTAITQLFLFAFVFACTYIYFDTLPARLPIHWGPSGPDRWVARTPQNVFGYLMSLMLVCIVFGIVILGIARGMRRIQALGGAGDAELWHRGFSIRVLVVLQYALIIPAMLPLVRSDVAQQIARFWGMGILLVIVWAVTTLMRSGQGGTHTVMTTLLEADRPLGDNTPDSCWKWGMFYYNPEDSSLIVEKRFGLGQTLNFANRRSWVVLALLAAPLVLLAIFAR